MKTLSIKKMVQIAILGATANVLMLLRFPLPFMPPFMDFDLSGVPEMLGAFLMGPAAGILIVVIKLLLKLLFTGSSSMLTGEIQNFILSCAYILPAGLLYKKFKTKKSAVLGMAIGTVACTIVAVFTNLYVIIPFYVKLYGLSMDTIIAMTQAVNPLVHNMATFVVLGVVPFNLIKCGLTSMVTYLLYPTLARVTGKEASHAI